jgi:hypothetical protein
VYGASIAMSKWKFWFKLLPVKSVICGESVRGQEDGPMKESRPFNRRAFLRLGAGIAAGVSMTVPEERNKALVRGSPLETASLAGGLRGYLPGVAPSPGPGKSPVTQSRKTLRPFGIFFANHNQDTGLHLWHLERWKREISDTRRMGARAIWYLPFQFGQRSRQDFQDIAPHWTLQRAICRAIIEAGLKVGIYLGLNDVFPDTWNEHPEWQAVRGDYLLEQAQVCPSVPEARQEMLRLRERLFAGLPKIDYVMTQITDYGGCGCDRCAPYPKTYLRVLEEQSALAKRYHPEVKIVASGLSASVADNDLLRELLRKMVWVDYVWEFPRGAKPVIEASLPETTMINGWGRFGPCPILSDIKRGYEYDLVHLSGVAHYCEGIHDDVNRFALLQFAQDPQRSVEDVARAYAEDWLKLRGSDAAMAGQVIAGLGTEIAIDRYYDSVDCGADNPQADEKVKILIDLRSRTHGLENNFRYWLLHYRAVCESFSVISGSLNLELLRKEADTARAALRRLEPEYGQFLAKLHPSLMPGHLALNWPRTLGAMWKRENSFA